MKPGTRKSPNIGHTISKSSGFSLLNPSGDLEKTQTIFEPLLSTLKDRWVHSTSAPTESSFANMLSDESLFLYFGHGSGCQYVSNRSVRSLTQCPVSWLMGCSSAALKTHGTDFEPSGMVLSYLAAGAPAVVGTLWDVTDRDCDRASVKAGEAWGLWRPGAATQKMLGIKGKRRTYEMETSRGTGGPSKEVAAKGRGGQKGARKVEERVSLVEAVRLGREECYLRYLNGAALVVYGIPVFLED
jgi:separase